MSTGKRMPENTIPSERRLKMTIEKILRNVTAAAVISGASEASAQEVKAREATPEETTTVFIVNDCFINDNDGPYTAASKENKEDWYQQKNLINTLQVTVLIQPSELYPGLCNFALDGFPQKYDLPVDTRTKDGMIEKSEMILNLSE